MRNTYVYLVLYHKTTMNSQIYSDILKALALIQDFTTSPENRESAENALIEFRKQSDAVIHIGAILTQEGGCMV